MNEVQQMRGGRTYECDFNITGMTDYCVTPEALLCGTEKVPLLGARIDVAFEGTIKARLTGKVHRDVKYLLLRADVSTPTDALTLTAEPQLKLKTAVASPCSLRASRPRERISR